MKKFTYVCCLILSSSALSDSSTSTSSPMIKYTIGAAGGSVGLGILFKKVSQEIEKIKLGIINKLSQERYFKNPITIPNTDEKKRVIVLISPEYKELFKNVSLSELIKLYKYIDENIDTVSDFKSLKNLTDRTSAYMEKITKHIK